jgi:hypothetical protein
MADIGVPSTPGTLKSQHYKQLFSDSELGHSSSCKSLFLRAQSTLPQVTYIINRHKFINNTMLYKVFMF